MKNEAVVGLNANEMLNALSLLVQTSPSGLWGEALHTSGLFAHLTVTLIEGEVRLTMLYVRSNYQTDRSK